MICQAVAKSQAVKLAFFSLVWSLFTGLQSIANTWTRKLTPIDPWYENGMHPRCYRCYWSLSSSSSSSPWPCRPLRVHPFLYFQSPPCSIYLQSSLSIPSLSTHSIPSDRPFHCLIGLHFLLTPSTLPSITVFAMDPSPLVWWPWHFIFRFFAICTRVSGYSTITSSPYPSQTRWSFSLSM